MKRKMNKKWEIIYDKNSVENSIFDGDVVRWGRKEEVISRKNDSNKNQPII